MTLSRKPWLTLIPALLGTLCAGPVPAAEAAAPSAELFTPAGPVDSRRPNLDPHITRSRSVVVDLRLLSELTAGGWMRLSLMPDQALNGLIRRSTCRGDQRTLSGTMEGLPESSFTMVVYRHAVAGVFRPGSSGMLYQLHYVGKGKHLLSEVDPAQYPPEGCFAGLPGREPGAAAEVQSVGSTVQPTGELETTSEAASACGPLPPVLDVMVLYTPAARQAMGGTHEAIIAQCQLAVAVANETYVKSLINPRMRLVHCAEANHTESSDPDATTAMGEDLAWLRSSPTVAQDRQTYRADFVTLIISYGSGYGQCGPGLYDASSVVRWDRAVNTWTLAHEIGHNQGCDHNREDAAAGCHNTSYAYGWHFFGDSGTEWGTVMSYLGVRRPHFSNPSVNYDGQPTGVPVGQPNESHNAQVINGTTVLCEAFLLTRYDIWVDFNFFNIKYEGTYGYPYRTLAAAVAEVPTGQNPSELPTLWIKSGSSIETVTINKPMTLRGCGGPVTIGQ